MQERFETFTVLINRISRDIRRIKNQEMAVYHLRSAHVSCLYYIYSLDGVTSAELCEHCEEDKATISRALDYLETNGFIVRDSDRVKRYRNPLRLTEKGQEVGKRIADWRCPRYGQPYPHGGRTSGTLPQPFRHQQKLERNRPKQRETGGLKKLKTRIIVDSTADLVPEIKARVYTVPLTVHFGQEEYLDGVTIDKHRFYERLVESDELPTTSQATPAAFDAIFSDVASVGDSAVVVTLASKFSGTYQSACIAAAEYDNIYIVDSKSAAIGSGILAEYALKCADKGMDAKTIAEALEKKRDEICLIALLDTLEYLKKGGRISKTVAFAGGLLNIKPVITVIDGEIQVIGKARGSKQGNNLLVQKIRESGGIDFDEPIILGYSGLSDSYLKKYVEDSRDIWQGKADSLDSTLICSVIGTHTGPGVVALAFFKKG